jgi:outer membrane receptor protein involved in Fe transport
LSSGTIVSACFDNAAFNRADPANGNLFCSYIKRDASGQVISDAANPGVITGFVNGNKIRMKGIQATVDFSTKLDGIGFPGTLEVSGDMFYLKYRLTDITGVAPVRSDGLLGDPKWQGQMRLRYLEKGWGMSTNINYIGRQLSSVTNRGPNPNDTREFDNYRPYATFDSSIFVDPMKNMRVILSVTNLFDRVGQNYFGYIAPSSVSDALGRRFSLTVRKTY